MTLEVRIPISPRPAWINRARLIAASVREWYPDARVQVSFGQAEMPTVNDMCTLTLACGENLRGVYGEAFTRWAGTRAEYSATIFNRFRGEFYGDWQLFMDADVLPATPFNELFTFDGIQGVVTHVPPWSQDEWRRLFTAFGLPLPAFNHDHTGAGIMCAHDTRGPRGYFNSGMLFGPRRWFEALEKPLFEAVEFLREALADYYWIDQVATCLAINAADIPTRDLSISYNFPNRKTFDDRYGIEDLTFVHFMDTSIVDRDRDFETPEAIAALCARTDLSGSNEVLRRRVAELV